MKKLMIKASKSYLKFFECEQKFRDLDFREERDVQIKMEIGKEKQKAEKQDSCSWQTFR